MEGILKLLIATRDELAEGYDKAIQEALGNEDIPLEAVGMLEVERNTVLGELDKRITKLALL